MEFYLFSHYGTNSFICSNFQYDKYLADLNGEVSFPLPKVKVQVKYFSTVMQLLSVGRTK